MDDLEIDKLLKQASFDLERGEYQTALALYQHCLESQPDVLAHYWNLGLVYLLQGEELDAQTIWMSPFLEESPEEFQRGMAELLSFLQVRGHQFLDRHQADLAETIYRQTLELDAENFVSYLYLGTALSEQGKYDEAICCYQQAIDLNSQNVEPYQLVGEILEKLQYFAEAISYYSQALAIAQNSEIAYRIGLCSLHLQQVDSAIGYFERSIQLDPDFAAAYSDLGYALLQRSQPNEAKTFWGKSLQLDSKFILAYLNLSVNKNDKTWSLLEQLLVKINSERARRNRHPKTEVVRQPNLDKRNLTGDRVGIPEGFYETTRDWAISQGRSDCYRTIFDNNVIKLKPPKTLDRSIHFSFRFGRSIQLPESFVAILPQGRYWLNSGQTRSATICSDNRLLGDLSPESPILEPGHPDKHPSQHSIFELDSLPPCREIEGTIAILSGLSNDIYFHWMLDILPRFELLKRSGINWDEIDYFLIDDRQSFQQESLQHLAIPPSKVMSLSPGSQIRASQLIVPSFPGSIAWMPSWTCDFLKTLFLSVEDGQLSRPRDRLYIRRANASSRRVLNENEVLKLLDRFGFRSATLESISVRDQAELLANCSIVIAPHGSGLTNLVFCQPGTKVIEIFSPNYVYPCYWLVSNLVDLEYYYLLGETMPGVYLQKLAYPDERHEDIVVDIEKLKTLIEWVLES
ncbi:MAG: DUF563 domain-containing protein [Cyanobacteria bacterium J055]|nr:MAG: DUF563 domain-containing protein [Cyanobacteria bacterium J055]